MLCSVITYSFIEWIEICPVVNDVTTTRRIVRGLCSILYTHMLLVWKGAGGRDAFATSSVTRDVVREVDRFQ